MLGNIIIQPSIFKAFIATLIYTIISSFFYPFSWYLFINIATFLLMCVGYFDSKIIGVSLRNLTLLAFFIFILLFPAIEYYNQILYWDRSFKILSVYTVTLLISLLWLCIYLATWFLTARNLNLKARKISVESKKTNLRLGHLLIFLLSCISTYIVLVFSDFQWFNLIFREKTSLNVEISTTSSLIFNNAIVPMAAISTLVLIARNSKPYLIFLSILLLMISSFPTALARFQAAQIYLALLLFMVPPLFYKRYLFDFIILIGLVFIFPILDLFRFYDPANGFQDKNFNFGWLRDGHFDSFQNFAALVYRDIQMMPEQFMGVMLFFIPRSFWPDKPIHSGAVLAKEENMVFDNIAMNFIGEGFITGGTFGVILFAVFFGIITAWCDIKIRSINMSQSVHCVSYILFCTTIFFFFRGALMSSYAYLLSALFIAFLLTQLSKLTWEERDYQ